jgi:twinkle protein
VHDYADYGINLNGKSGEEVSTLCPKCSHTRSAAGQKKPCLRVNTVKGVWCCQHPTCGWKGGLGTGTRPYQPSRPERRPVFPVPDSTRDPRLIEWFHNRGISEEVVAAHAIGLTTRYFSSKDDVPSIQFPYYFNGEVVNVKYRSLEGKHFSQEKGGLKVLYGIDKLLAGATAVIVEGECDVLAIECAEISCAVSVPDGAPAPGSKCSDLKFEYLQNCKAQLDKLTKIIIAVDNDAAGKTLEAELIRRLGPDRCWRVTWPEGCKDANDVLLKYGKDELRRCIDEAKPMPIEGVITGADLVDDLVNLYQNGTTKGLSTGIPGLDRLYLPRPGELSIVYGIPMRGKSTFVETVLVSMAKLHGWSFAVCSPESQPPQKHMSKFVEKYIGLPFEWRNGSRMNTRQMAEGVDWFHEHFYLIAPPEMVTPDYVLGKAEELVRKNGIRGLLMDPWNEFTHTMPFNAREDQYLAGILGKIRRFAERTGVHVWIVTHPPKVERNKDKRDGPYPIIGPYEIAGGAMFHNKANHMVSVHRPDSCVPGYTEIHHQKCKEWGATGYPGMLGLILDPITGQYSEAPNN